MRIFLWFLMACQLAVWAWFSVKGGKLSDKHFLFFTVGMLAGQAGGAIETFWMGAWGTCFVQIYFFIFTAYGGWKRYREMKENSESCDLR